MRCYVPVCTYQFRLWQFVASGIVVVIVNIIVSEMQIVWCCCVEFCCHMRAVFLASAKQKKQLCEISVVTVVVGC